ncbi:MAG: alkylhydroperoxidase/carboxymuconolactone decarboxylase family protein YurZ [Glaciecola sp.]|jgi:alkylhydroperoxidase/carboxymuconolactone decarboxylase family protein YurZ
MTPPLSASDERLVELVSAVARRDWEGLAELRRGAPEGEPDERWREALIQSHLFLGFPSIVEAFEVISREGGMHAPTEPEHENPGTDFEAQGAPIFDGIYADLAPVVRRRLAQHHPDFAHWIAEHAYGRVLARPGLTAAMRELLAIVCLLHTNLDRQLASHTRGAVRLGASAHAVHEVFKLVSPHLDAEDSVRLAEVIERFLPTEES